MDAAPLADLRILAIEQYGAGPFGSLHLADLGADVIKIEDPATGGDIGRSVPPFADGDDSLFFQTFNRGKRSISLDLSSPAGYGVLLDLVKHADAVYSNLRGDIPAKLRLRYDDLKEANPRIVCVSLSGFGMDSSRAADPAYDYILQGLTGWMSLTGEPDGPPTKTGLSMVDYLGGIIAAFSVIAGVHAARRDCVGRDCDVSLYDVAMSMLTYPAAWWLNGGHLVDRTHHSAHPSLVPFQNFPTADGWVVVGCAKEKFWQRLTVALRRPELATDPRFTSFAQRRENAGELIGMLESIFLTRTTQEWLDVLSDAGVPCGPVNDITTALADPHVDERAMLVDVAHPLYGTLRLPATAVKIGDHAPAAVQAPDRNADADAVLGGLLGYAADHRQELDAAGAFGLADKGRRVADAQPS